MTSILGRLSAGPLGDKINPVTVFGGGLGLMGVAQIGCGFSTSCDCPALARVLVFLFPACWGVFGAVVWRPDRCLPPHLTNLPGCASHTPVDLADGNMFPNPRASARQEIQEISADQTSTAAKMISEVQGDEGIPVRKSYRSHWGGVIVSYYPANWLNLISSRGAPGSTLCPPRVSLAWSPRCP